MEKLIYGTHHISLKCGSIEEFNRTVEFYHGILGCDILWENGEGENSVCMIDTGDVQLEIFAKGKNAEKGGTVNHFALLATDIHEAIDRCRKAGYEVTCEIGKSTMPANPPYDIYFAFVKGPLGEDLEFFEML